MSKTCTKCQVSKPLTSFWKNKRSVDGRDTRCSSCINEKRRSRYTTDEDYRAKTLVRNKEWVEENIDYRLNYLKKWKLKNPEKMREYWDRHYFKNKWKYTESSNRRRKGLRQATLNLPDDKAKVDLVYLQAKDCTLTTGEPYEVDHILPLKGKDVCGLHVSWNLQVLPQDLNRAKSNGSLLNREDVLDPDREREYG